MEKRKIEKKVNKIKSQFFKKINKIHKPLAGLTKEKHTHPHNSEMQGSGGHYNQVYRNRKDYTSTTNNCTPTNRLDNLETKNSPRMNNEKKRKTEKAYNKKIKLIIKNFPTKKISGLIALLVNSTKHLKI